MPVFGTGDIAAIHRPAVPGGGADHRRVAVFLRRQRRGIGLSRVLVAVGELVGRNDRKDEFRPEVLGQADEQPGFQRRPQRQITESRRHQFVAPEVRVLILRLRQLEKQILARRILLVAGQRRIERRAVDLVLQVIAVAPDRIQ